MLSKSSFVMSFVQPLDNAWSAGLKDDVAFSGGGNPPEEGRALLRTGRRCSSHTRQGSHGVQDPLLVAISHLQENARPDHGRLGLSSMAPGG